MKNVDRLWFVVGLVWVSSLGGCVAAECRDGSHAEGDKCVADESDAGDSGSGGDNDAGIDDDAGMQPIVCDVGYENVAGACSDIDECVTNNGGCHSLTTCTNTLGARECGLCPTGYTGNGASGCVDINECAENNDDCDADPAATCVNTDASFNCDCPNGFQGNGHGDSGCVDVDECLDNNGGCDTQPMVACANNSGGRACGACPTGYTGDGVGDEGCVDLNECATNNGGCDAAATCTNTAGSFGCGACPSGYTGDGAHVNGCVPELASLRVTPGFGGASFNPSTLSYSMTVGQLARYVEVFATTSVVGATVTVGTQPVDEYNSSFAWVGSGSATLIVAVADRYNRTRNYSLVVSREGTVSQRAYIKPFSPVRYEAFGLTVATDGDTLVAGGSGPQDSNVSVFVRTGTAWAYQATINRGPFATYNPSFGREGLDVDGDTLVVGQSDFVSNGVNGSVAVYVRTGSSWEKQATLFANNREIDDGFGRSVAISGDRIVVGAPGEDSGDATNPGSNIASGSGAVYVFSRSGTTWTQEFYVKANNVGVDDAFGNDVDLYRETLLVGAPGEDGSGWGVNPSTNDARSNSGAAYIYKRDTLGAWTQAAYIKNDESTAAAARAFGYGVALGNETHAVVGAPGNGGGAFVFHSPQPGAWAQFTALGPYDTDQDGFGESVAMWGPGVIVVSARGDDSSATSVNGNHNNTVADSGAAYVFLRGAPATSSQFSLSHYLKALNAEADDGAYSASPGLVAVAGDAVFTTAPREDSTAYGVQTPGPTATTDEDYGAPSAWDTGAAYLFR